ncbi:enolase C-terminal domain-like protein [Gordonia sp. (in: high G+C Gram-positive bacteria)]|uniref:mandelate racemase/muconate lactonizing enzyme family protein n=1 Tax=Gordonia sp. (in: high G+C Gram-positive bacteria) TaxID=84139 RepID=UPI001698084D|nr:enolase C-terminal domain-like protein [Gordonia sp. (in: high G+C Gram-positive bacteria)]NLG45289.1 enolase [Gordonia sp. (in: high G+C Gram-positive bacteria)]
MSDLEITAVEAIPYSIRYRKPLRFASGEITHAQHVLIRVHTKGGLIGSADAPPRPFTYGETQAGVIAVIESLFAPQIVGVDADRRDLIRQRMHRTVGNPVAKAAIDMALWDIIGQAWSMPVHRLLGGFTDKLRVSHMLGFDTPEVMVAEAGKMRDRYGISTFKVKVGRRPIDADVEVVRALRQTLGDKAELYIDGNRGWSPSESARALEQLADVGLTLAEELCPADDVLGRRWLVNRCSVPFVADESVSTSAEVTRELLGGSATAISIKTARTGFSGSEEILHLATGLGVEVVMGNQIDGQLGTACTVAFGAAHEATSRRAGELSNFLDMSDDLLTEPLEIVDGYLAARTGPGIGVSIDPDKLQHFRTDK